VVPAGAVIEGDGRGDGLRRIVAGHFPGAAGRRWQAGGIERPRRQRTQGRVKPVVVDGAMLLSGLAKKPA